MINIPHFCNCCLVAGIGMLLVFGYYEGLAFAQNTNEHVSPSIPQLESDYGEKSFVVEVFFNDRTNVEYEGSQISHGRAHTHISAPPMLHAVLLDENESVLGCFNSWHPMWVFTYGADEEEHLIIQESTKASFIFPFHPDMTTFKLFDIPLNQELISVDLQDPTNNFCAENPADSACIISAESDERRTFGSFRDVMIPYTILEGNIYGSVPTVENSSCFLSPIFEGATSAPLPTIPTVELDQDTYSWTDKAYITIVAPDHNLDDDLVDEIGDSDMYPVIISTKNFVLDNYRLVETGTDTGIFTGEIILTGFTHDADGNPATGDSDGNDVISSTASGTGPTDGFLPADNGYDDGLTVSFEFSEDETIVDSALIRWNIGEVQWIEASYPASGTGVVRVIDPDMNLDPEAVDNFDVDVWSDSDAGGIDLTVTETHEATGIFEGTVLFITLDESSGHRLRVAEGDTVTAEYEDNTLPDPYTAADELDITATSLIGTVVPPLERAPIASCRVVDFLGNSLSNVSVDQQVQITCNLANGQDREQAFAYLVQIQDENGVTIALAWITGSLSPGQSFSPALSWIPEQAGVYDATAFVWEDIINNPTALSSPVSVEVMVN